MLLYRAGMDVGDGVAHLNVPYIEGSRLNLAGRARLLPTKREEWYDTIAGTSGLPAQQQ